MGDREKRRSEIIDMRIEEKQIKNEAVVCVVGSGYVGQPLAEAFSNSLSVIGFDVDENDQELKKRGFLYKTL